MKSVRSREATDDSRCEPMAKKLRRAYDAALDVVYTNAGAIRDDVPAGVADPIVDFVELLPAKARWTEWTGELKTCGGSKGRRWSTTESVSGLGSASRRPPTFSLEEAGGASLCCFWTGRPGWW
jgi:hypothetical protein